jgi:broad specificity phosphatase PhoE
MISGARYWYIWLLAGSLCGAACTPHHMSEQAATTVILVRHADRASTPPDDPPLTAAGVARAHELATALRNAGVQTIITTQFSRTKTTASPLAEFLGLKPEIIADEPPDTGRSHARSVARAILERHRGQTILVVGHGHTVPAIIAALGAPAPEPICESVFDGLYIVTLPANGPPRIIHARYGAPSSTDSACTRRE